jgi:hypothetical protein
VQRGEFADGLRYLRDARSRAAADPGISDHIAVALKEMGRMRRPSMSSSCDSAPVLTSASLNGIKQQNCLMSYVRFALPRMSGQASACRPTFWNRPSKSPRDPAGRLDCLKAPKVGRCATFFGNDALACGRAERQGPGAEIADGAVRQGLSPSAFVARSEESTGVDSNGTSS